MMSIFQKKKLMTKSRKRQILLKLSKITCTLLEKILDLSTIRLGYNWTTKLKISKVKNKFLYNLKKINFKFRTTNRYQLKLTKSWIVIIAKAFIGGLWDLSLFNFSCGYKKNNK